MSQPLNITTFHGINIDCLGHYLMGLGLLRAVSGKWNEARGCWHNSRFHLAGPFTETDVSDFILQNWQPTPYEKWWTSAQKADTKAKTSTQLWQIRSSRPLLQVRVADCSIVPTNRNQFSPLFDNIGKRNLETAWREASELRARSESGKWLEAALFGRETAQSPPFSNAGTWFVYDNKTFNSGLNWYREGSLSPWSFLLAMEGALLVRGGSGRRLGARAQPYAVFPFVSQPLQPAAAEEVGQNTKGEFWAPLWEQPATLGEVRVLFQRGLARIGGRAAAAPHEFAVAVLAAGADAGVTQFVRFELRQTTSSQVYEALPRQTFAIAKALSSVPDEASPSVLLSEFLGRRWFDLLPREPGPRASNKKFSGLRGPLERLVLAVAQEPENPEPWRDLLLRLAETQARVDRNLKLRKSCRALPWLPPSWLSRVFPGIPPLNVRCAVAFASLGSGSERPAICNVFGVTSTRSGRIFFPEARPPQAVWQDGEAQGAILDLVQRRLIDSKVGDLSSSLETGVHLTAADVTAFLCADAATLEEVHRWLPAMALLDWRRPGRPWPFEPYSGSAEPSLLLWSFFKPFFTTDDIKLGDCKFFRDGAGPKSAFTRQVFNLLRHGAMTEAITLALAGYQAQGLRVIQPAVPVAFNHGRLAGALALSISTSDLARLVNRWLEPLKNNAGEKP
ncbi:MAG TPA: type I-U CRISPR-associated protein Csx17 [Verrucomicrobiae bacterium]|nr:type I-U CRISPR-associated protein Csx17 [Verrucomicrobiae bacterium]